MKEKGVEKVYHTITDVCGIVNVKASTIRFYESKLVWLRPQKIVHAKRKYRWEEIELVLNVVTLMGHGMTIEGVSRAWEQGYFKELIEFFNKK